MGFEVSKRAIAKIHHQNNTDAIVGTGFLIAERYLLTCAHVVQEALSDFDNIIGSTLSITFFGAFEPQSVQVIFFDLEPSSYGRDAAILYMMVKSSLSVNPAPRFPLRQFNNAPLQVFGYPGNDIAGRNLTAVTRGEIDGGWVQVEDTKEPGIAIEPGFSGSPAWQGSPVSGIVGMVVARHQGQGNEKVGFILPMQRLQNAIKITKYHSLLMILKSHKGNITEQIETAYKTCCPDASLEPFKGQINQQLAALSLIPENKLLEFAYHLLDRSGIKVLQAKLVEWSELYKDSDFKEAIKDKSSKPTDAKIEYTAKFGIANKLTNSIINSTYRIITFVERVNDAIDYRLLIKYSSINTLITLIVLSLRLFNAFGIFEKIELGLYDHVLTSRLPEDKSDRVVIIEVDTSDIENEDQKATDKNSKLTEDISAKTFASVIDRLNEYEAKVIGIDFYLPEIKEEWAREALDKFKSNQQIYGLCLQPYQDIDESEPPPFSDAISSERVGFSNLFNDEDGIVRRQVIKFPLTDEELNSDCKSEISFNMLIALRYLELTSSNSVDLDYSNLRNDALHNHTLQIKNTLIRGIDEFEYGGYNDLEAGGFQLLINYREPKGNNPNESFSRFSVSELIEGDINPELIRDKIVLFGLVGRLASDDFFTPYGQRRIYGVTLHAHMIDQIVSTVLDDRQLVWVWPDWGEYLWISGWSLVGGLIGSLLRNPHSLFIYLTAINSIIYLICLGVMMAISGWIPMLPAFMVFSTSGVFTRIFSTKFAQITPSEADSINKRA